MNRYLSLFVIALCLPFVLWAVCGILPTFDDFTTLQSPWWVQIADPGYFFPDSVRRPFDALLGYIVGCNPSLFPTLNHVLIILGHTASSFLLYALCRRLRLSPFSSNIATLFFFFSPATLGATLACDGFNQTYAQLWGLLALWTYLSSPITHHSSLITYHSSLITHHFSLFCVLMATLSKENGLAWAVVPPIIAFAFGRVTLCQAVRDAGKGILLAVAYFVVFFLLIHSGIVPIDYPEEYSGNTFMGHLKDLAQLLAYTYMPLDYMSAVYAPSRNLAIVAVTALAAIPFLLILAVRWWQSGIQIPLTSSVNCPSIRLRVLLLVACFFILVSPHLVTVVSIMHNYAALSIAALIVATILSSAPSKTFVSIFSFALFLAAAIFTDVHHCIAARESGLIGKHLAMQAIEQTDRPVGRAMVISIDDESEPRYSSFCVRPVDAFAWGLAVRHYTGYTWKTVISETTLPTYDRRQVEALADSALHSGNEVVWVVGHRSDSLAVFSNRK